MGIERGLRRRRRGPPRTRPDVWFSGTTAGIDWDIGAVYYWYPGANSNLNYDYWEVPLLLSYGLDYGFSLLGEYYYSPDFFGGSGQAHYLLGGLRWEYPIRGSHSASRVRQVTSGSTTTRRSARGITRTGASPFQ
ncbi:MAG: hypothetical protein HWD60_12060 [Defluviicoccus sp.]|nr:MAG: hypothetical protein HWD60_12060 [Defluviicoccus sp.]